MRLTFAGCLAAALVLHGALAFAVSKRAVAPSQPRVLEIELPTQAAPAPIEPAPPVAPSPLPAPEPPPLPRSAPKAPTATAAPAPAAARAAPLLTAADTARAAADEPVSFVTDPNGTTYGSGVVARGGAADHGAPSALAAGAASGTGTAVARPTVAAAAPGEVVTPASDLSRAPRLEEADACRGFFPRGASSDSATVSLLVIVRPSGAVGSVSLLAESPAGEGFGAAARTCLASKRFTPALDRAGGAATAAARVNVRFLR
jgi:hypothetical protein